MWQPDVTVAAICQRDGHFLMVEERAKSNQQIVLNQPAGHIEDGETLIQAVVRETLEETCRHFQPTALIGLYRLKTPANKTYLRYAFCGEIGPVDSARQLDPDIITTHWMTLAELQASTALRSELVLACVNDYCAGVHYPLEVLREL